jgi:hypothetical protein
LFIRFHGYSFCVINSYDRYKRGYFACYRWIDIIWSIYQTVVSKTTLYGFIQYMLSLCIWKCILINQRNLKIYIFRYVSVFEIRVHSSFWCTTLYDKVCQWLAAGQWFSPVSPTNKNDRQTITEILLKVALNTQTLTFDRETYRNVWYMYMYILQLL